MPTMKGLQLGRKYATIGVLVRLGDLCISRPDNSSAGTIARPFNWKLRASRGYGVTGTGGLFVLRGLEHGTATKVGA